MSYNQNQRPQLNSQPQSPDETLKKMQRFVNNNRHLTNPSPLPNFTWSSIEALEASLLVSVVATSTELHRITQLPNSTNHTQNPQYLTTANRCNKRYSEIMRPASICCKALNTLREEKFVGNLALVEDVFVAMRFVRDRHNPILARFVGSEVERWRWIRACLGYVEDVVARIERAAGELKKEGFT